AEPPGVEHSAVEPPGRRRETVEVEQLLYLEPRHLQRRAQILARVPSAVADDLVEMGEQMRAARHPDDRAATGRERQPEVAQGGTIVARPRQQVQREDRIVLAVA